MRCRLVPPLLLLLLPLGLGAQTVASGALSGLEAEGRLPWVRWALLEAPPFHASHFEAGVPAGSFIVDWEGFSPAWTGFGWSLSQENAATTATAGAPHQGGVRAQWAGTAFEATASSPWTFSVEHRWKQGVGGGWASGTEGTLQTSEPLEFGSWAARGWGAWAGWAPWVAFYGEASAEVIASRNLFFWSFEGQGQAEVRWAGVAAEGLLPLWWFTWDWEAAAGYAEGRLQADVGRNILGQGRWKTSEESRARGVAGWLDQNWHAGAWSLGLGTGAAVFWVENPTWTQTRTWTETQFPWWPLPFPFVIVEKTSTTDYTFEASPGWVVVFRPLFSWRPFPGTTLTLSRWLPLSGGTRLAIDASTVAGGPEGGSGGAPSISVRNLWLAGTQLDLSASW